MSDLQGTGALRQPRDMDFVCVPPNDPPPRTFQHIGQHIGLVENVCTVCVMTSKHCGKSRNVLPCPWSKYSSVVC